MRTWPGPPVTSRPSSMVLHLAHAPDQAHARPSSSFKESDSTPWASALLLPSTALVSRPGLPVARALRQCSHRCAALADEEAKPRGWAMPEGSGQVQAEPEPRTRAGPESTPCTAPLTPALALTGQCPSLGYDRGRCPTAGRGDLPRARLGQVRPRKDVQASETSLGPH